MMKIISALLLYTMLFLSGNNKIEKTSPVTENITESVYASAIIKQKINTGSLRPLTV